MNPIPTFDYPLRSTRTIKLQQVALVLAAMAVVSALIFGFWQAPVVMTFFTILLAVIFSPIKNVIPDNPPGCWWLPSVYCSELLELCETHPELAAYRERVLEQGRRFTFGEYQAMRAWPEEKERQIKQRELELAQEAACKRLYLSPSATL